jgi:hypothetical protein
MNRTTTVVVALIAAAGLSTMVYAVPEQRTSAWLGGGFGGCGFGFGGCGFGFGDRCGFGCGVGFFGEGFHKQVIQTINQINTCRGNGDDQKGYSDNEDQNQKDKQTVCLNTAVNSAGQGFITLGAGSLNPIDGHKQPGKEIAIQPIDGHKQPGKEIAIGGNGGSGGAGGAGGEGGQGGKNAGDNTSKSNSSVNQKATGGGANGGYGGNANGGDARTVMLIFTLR